MKVLFVLAAVLMLNSCNTAIGVYRDGKQAFEWTRSKFQSGSAGGGGGGDEQYGAPVY